MKLFLFQGDLALTPATCHEGTKLIVNDTVYDLSKIGCKNSVPGNIMERGTQCANNRGTYMSIGHKISEHPEIFLSLINCCYDKSIDAALYSEHTIYGSALGRMYCKIILFDYIICVLISFKINCKNYEVWQKCNDTKLSINTALLLEPWIEQIKAQVNNFFFFLHPQLIPQR